MTRPRPTVVVLILWRRELIHFVRRPARIAAALGTPVLLWLFLASGFARSLRPEHVGIGVEYAAFMLPGIMTLVAVFAAVFSSLSVIEARQEGWLQSLLASPAPRWSMAAGLVLAGASVAWVQAALCLAGAPLANLDLSPGPVLIALAALLVTCTAMTALGIAFAWRSASSASYHAVMNLVFLPMWMLSGAFFPVQGSATWMNALVAVNPLTWCTEAIRGPLLGADWASPLALAGAFAIVCVGAAVRVVGGAPGDS